jgi:hypothetical protein
MIAGIIGENERKCERTRVEVAVGHPEHCGMPMQSVVKASNKRCDVRWNMTSDEQGSACGLAGFRRVLAQ